jgi:5'-3' exonuclease
MDCNSIIYDAYRIIENKHKELPIEQSKIEPLIISYVLEKIRHYIEFIKPTTSVFITFDGVAPFAKMSQQKTRRYKTEFSKMLDQQTLFQVDMLQEPPLWNTTSITPGTNFMGMLSKSINKEFSGQERKYNVESIFISCSDEPGEGEHKLFEKIRNESTEDEVFSIYGLDSDLIMLSIFHLQYAKNIFVFREAPEFKNILPADYSFNSDEKLFLDIDSLHLSIFNEMGSENKNQSVYDYIFMCFLLGNDFLPHFPALNIRTNGIRYLMNSYKETIGKYNERGLVSVVNGKIQWNNVRLFFDDLAKKEHQFILKEYSIRDKMDGRVWADNTPEEKAQLLLNVPVIYRQIEKYINPKDSGWDVRYYKSLFVFPKNNKITNGDIKNICINYLQGLEWVFKYYTSGCPDWKWKYNYSYPPLLRDLIKYTPISNTEFILPHKNNFPFSPYLQLAYVLPKSQLQLLPRNMELHIRENYINYYPDQYEFIWAFCRYFWEAHPVLNDIPKDILEKLDCVLREMAEMK